MRYRKMMFMQEHRHAAPAHTIALRAHGVNTRRGTLHHEPMPPPPPGLLPVSVTMRELHSASSSRACAEPSAGMQKRHGRAPRSQPERKEAARSSREDLQRVPHCPSAQR